MKGWFFNGWVWFASTAVILFLCAIVPIRLRHEKFRRVLYWVMLIPLSILLILYVYPVGIELFRRMALSP